MTNYNPTFYVDMDGVLADFMGEPNALERFAHERGFFTLLKPFTKNLEAVRNAWAHGAKIFILSASPNEQADQDKIKWLARHFPELPTERVILMRNGQNKADYMKTESGILLDDYGKNCVQWCARNFGHNRAVKIKQDGDIATALQAVRVLKTILINAD